MAKNKKFRIYGDFEVCGQFEIHLENVVDGDLENFVRDVLEYYGKLDLFEPIKKILDEEAEQ